MDCESNQGAINLIGLWGKAYREQLGKDPRLLCKRLMKEQGIPKLHDLSKKEAFKFLRLFMREVKQQVQARNAALRHSKEGC
ncbi:hypothetical protein MOO46_07860 (plasmid) [Apilactobacillus apisilvae]|uniref:Transposase n=1 Tax=Apilactobacillus apisilvae TaxID=2923364 RepID=A0ABY4PK78_9LACO|nr:hypothetical protein [Apilactobacillus apisilvae]UQS85847.1 hypothetical protein MOO46_07860 [Apilactobacillus apisilvae]